MNNSPNLNATNLSDAELKASYKKLWDYLLPQFRFFIFAIIGFSLYALSQPALAMLIEIFVEALEGKVNNGVYLVPLACAAIALFRGVGSYLGTYYMAKVTERMMHAIRSDLFRHLVQLPLGFFDKNKTGRLVSLFTYNTNVMTNTTAKAVTIVIREGLTVIALFAYLLYQNFKLTLIFLLLGPPVALLINWIGKKIKKLGLGIQSSMGELNHIAAENFSGIRLLKSYAAETTAIGTFVNKSAETLKLALRMAKVNSIYTPVMQMMIATALALLMYAVLLSRDTTTTAALIAYITAAFLLPKPVRSLNSVHPQLLQGAVAGAEVFRQITFDTENDTGTIESGLDRGRIEFRNVSFRYESSNEDILKNVSFLLEPGKTLAVVGRSGGGKSTLVNLVSRFYPVSEGEILVDGIPLDDFKLGYLRRNIAIVSQNVSLFNTSVANNIAFGLLDESNDKVIENENSNENGKANNEEINEAVVEAAKAANAHEFIKELPDGYNTIVGENGVLLSGGQRQRLSIARALLRNTPILILDEATSALDNESEVRVQQALEKIMAGRTTIVIAHRLSTIEHADHILVLEKGQIIEQGTHQQLMASGKSYAQMVQRDFSE